MRAEFEEKQYEQLLNNELASKKGILSNTAIWQPHHNGK